MHAQPPSQGHRTWCLSPLASHDDAAWAGCHRQLICAPLCARTPTVCQACQHHAWLPAAARRSQPTWCARFGPAWATHTGMAKQPERQRRWGDRGMDNRLRNALPCRKCTCAKAQSEHLDTVDRLGLMKLPSANGPHHLGGPQSRWLAQAGPVLSEDQRPRLAGFRLPLHRWPPPAPQQPARGAC